MMKTDFYLAHPLNMRHKVRDELQVPLQDMGYTTHNPFYDKDLQPRQDVALIDKGRAMLYDISLTRAREIVKSDLDAIDNTRTLIAYLPRPGIGTSMEIFYAGHVLKKPTFIGTSEAYMRHPWIQTYSSLKKKTIAELLEFIMRRDHSCS